jgi:hypothetical protein
LISSGAATTGTALMTPLGLLTSGMRLLSRWPC